jgi:CPA1 family monovalent cation:H+ antiporter
MATLEIILLLLAASAGLELLARKIHVPRPTLLVCGGLLLALLPGLPVPPLDPDLLFLIFIPPLLYWNARGTSLRDLRANFRSIGLLAFGLVIATICVVAVVAHAMTPRMTWASAFTLGAIVSPPDVVAATAVTSRLGVSRLINTILGGEGLLNDATALVAYRMAVAAQVSGHFSAARAALQLLWASGGGIAIGLLVGWLVSLLRGAVEQLPAVDNTVSLLTPFIAFIPAEHLGMSGVLSVVTAALYLGRQASTILSAATRVQVRSLWVMVTFLLEGLVFIITGLELPRVTAAVRLYGLWPAIEYTAIISTVCIGIRLLWVFPSAYLPRVLLRRLGRQTDWPPWRGVLFIGWAGIRGADSLVIALALPRPFPARALIIFITFGVILVSLIVQGITLEPLIRLLRLPSDDTELIEERDARRRAVEAGLKRLDDETGTIPDEMRERHVHRAHRYGEPGDSEADADREQREEYRRLRLKMLEGEREELIRLRDENVIGDDVLHRIEAGLDLEELLLDESSVIRAGITVG